LPHSVARRAQRCRRVCGSDPAVRVGPGLPKASWGPVGWMRRCRAASAVPGSERVVLVRAAADHRRPAGVPARRVALPTGRRADCPAAVGDRAVVDDGAGLPGRSSAARASVRPATAAGHWTREVRNARRELAARRSTHAAARPGWPSTPAAVDPEGPVAVVDRAGRAGGVWSGRSTRAGRHRRACPAVGRPEVVGRGSGWAASALVLRCVAAVLRCVAAVRPATRRPDAAGRMRPDPTGATGRRAGNRAAALRARGERIRAHVRAGRSRSAAVLRPAARRSCRDASLCGPSPDARVCGSVPLRLHRQTEDSAPALRSRPA
jgi:hypothetical protein